MNFSYERKEEKRTKKCRTRNKKKCHLIYSLLFLSLFFYSLIFSLIFSSVTFSSLTFSSLIFGYLLSVVNRSLSLLYIEYRIYSSVLSSYFRKGEDIRIKIRVSLKAYYFWHLWLFNLLTHYIFYSLLWLLHVLEKLLAVKKINKKVAIFSVI